MTVDRNNVFGNFSPELIEGCVVALLSQVNILRIAMSLPPVDMSDLLRNIDTAVKTSVEFDFRKDPDNVV